MYWKITDLRVQTFLFSVICDRAPNLRNRNTRTNYERDITQFLAFAGIGSAEQLREVTRPHVLAWRDYLQGRGLANDTIRRKLAALSSLYASLCDRHAVLHNPVLGVKRPPSMNRDGATPALGDDQALRLLEAPPAGTLKGKRDRAMLAVLLYHGIRREELCKLRVGDVQSRQGVWHLRIEGKREKIRYIPLAIAAQRLITAYLAEAKHGDETDGPLFRPVKNNTTGTLAKALHKRPSGIWSSSIPSRSASPGPRHVLACMPCGRRPPPMPWSMAPTSPRCRSGWACGYLHHAAV